MFDTPIGRPYGLMHWLRVHFLESRLPGNGFSRSGRWVVLYPGEGLSMKCDYFTACDMAEIHKGQVLRVGSIEHLEATSQYLCGNN